MKQPILTLLSMLFLASCAPEKGYQQHTAVILTMGQSNAANFAETKYDPLKDVQAYTVGGHYTHAIDPQPGADGPWGSVWSRLGDAIINSKMYDHVILISIAQGGTMVEQWADGYLNQRIITTLDDLNAHHIVPTYILWHQGESDKNANTTKARYIEEFLKVRATIRMRGFVAPIYIAHATYSNGLYSQEVYDAQTELVQTYPDLKQGPDTDTLTGPGERYDNAHFTDKGVNDHAALWLDVLEKN